MQVFYNKIQIGGCRLEYHLPPFLKRMPSQYKKLIMFNLPKILEALLLSSREPLTLEKMQSVFDPIEAPDFNELQQALAELSINIENTPNQLVEIATGWRLQVRQAYSPWVSRLFDERQTKYSRAALETLALIAYRQPITRAEIEEIRGVVVSSQIMRNFIDREWVKVLGHRELPGRPTLYGTTKTFLNDLGLKSLSELPSLTESDGFESKIMELSISNPVDSVEAPTNADEPTTLQ